MSMKTFALGQHNRRPVLHTLFITLLFFIFAELTAHGQTTSMGGDPLVPCTAVQERSAQCGDTEYCFARDPRRYPKASFESVFGDIPTCRSTIAGGLTAIGCTSRPREYRFCYFELSGPITRSQADALEKFTSSHATVSRFNVTISSPGGDIDAAMRLGTIIRKNGAFVEIYKNCASACVLVLAGGVIRSGFQWPVTIHRPYRAAVTELGVEQAQREYEARNAAIAAYLKRMNVPASLLDAMLAVPSHESRVLSEKELREYGLSEPDPVYEEEANIASAKALEISISEYLGRKSAWQDCRASYDWSPESIAICGRQFPGVR